MTKNVLFPTVFLVALSTCALVHAELPPLIASQLKSEAEKYDAAMKEYADKIVLLIKIDRDNYLTVLKAARKREEGAKRTKSVAAIDAELKAVEAGPLPEAAPADLPKDVARYRTRYVTSPDRAEKAVASVRKFTRNGYLKWLDGMAAVARRAKNKELEAAVAKEEKRVRASEAEAEADGEDADESRSPSSASAVRPT